MRASAMLLAVAVVAVTASVASAAVRAGDADCSAALTPTVTFVTSCSTISATDAACWTPHAPGAADVVLFPSGTAASVPFEDEFTPLSVGSIVVATGAQVTMNGGAFVVSTCLQVAGVLSLFVPEAQLDNGTKSTVPYPADASVPHGTDCSTVSRGFSPRVCGPGAAYVTGSLKLGGLYASLWASTTVASSASLIVDGESFVWGNVSNFGTISANERFYLHGEITNNPGGNVQVTQVRADYWTEVENHTQVPVAITNYGTFTLTISKNLHNNYDIVSTKDFNSTTVVALVIVNHGSLVFNSWLRGGNSVEVWGELALEITNFGTLTWRGNQGFLGLGSLTNYGELVADRSAVDFQNFVSHGGTQTTLNGGSFGFGVSQAIKEKLLIKGVRGPYKSTLVFTNSRFHSRDGSGVFRVHSPLTVVGELMVTPQATLVNEMPFVGAGVVSRGSGVLVVRGVYVAGVKESIMPLSGRVRIAHSGSMEVPEGSEVMLYDGADFHMEAGALLRVSGSVITRKSYVPKMTLHPHAFVVGLEKVSGDFSLDGRLAVLDA